VASSRRVEARAPGGICGEETFYEHVHFNFDGNYLLARAWAEAIAPSLPPTFTNHISTEWASQAVCEQRLVLTDWNRAAVLDKALDIIKAIEHGD